MPCFVALKNGQTQFWIRDAMGAPYIETNPLGDAPKDDLYAANHGNLRNIPTALRPVYVPSGKQT